jgi:hypothetical protein
MGGYFGISLAWSPIQSNALRQLPSENKAHGVAIINTFIQLGSALGTPLFVGLMTTGERTYLANINSLHTAIIRTQALYSGFRYSITVATVIFGMAFLVSLSLKFEKTER